MRTQAFFDHPVWQANETANARYAEVSEPSPDATESEVTAYQDSETSIDELALEADLSRKRGRKPT